MRKWTYVCSALQFKTWFELLVGAVEYVEKQEQFLNSGETATQKMNAFEVEAKEYHYLLLRESTALITE